MEVKFWHTAYIASLRFSLWILKVHEKFQTVKNWIDGKHIDARLKAKGVKR